MITMCLYEGLARTDETEASGIFVIQINQLKQGVCPLDRGGVQFAHLGFQVRSFLRDRIDFRFLAGKGENPSSGNKKDGKELISFH
jgi:hypothetical protein